jgi:hypothetical protein
MRVIHGLLTGLLLALTVGCESGTVLATRSGRPEVSIRGRTTEQIQRAATAFFEGRGYTLTHEDPLRLTFERPHDKPAGEPFTAYCLRVRLNIGEDGDGSHRVLAMPYGVSNCGQAFESETPMQNAYPQIQSFLESIRNELDAAS